MQTCVREGHGEEADDRDSIPVAIYLGGISTEILFPP